MLDLLIQLQTHVNDALGHVHILTQIGVALAAFFFCAYILKKKPYFAILAASCLLYALVPVMGAARSWI